MRPGASFCYTLTSMLGSTRHASDEERRTMVGSARSGARRAVLALGAALMLFAGLTAWPVFPRGDAIPFASPAFAAQWDTAEAAIPNFCGPAFQPSIQEAYKESPGGQ